LLLVALVFGVMLGWFVFRDGGTTADGQGEATTESPSGSGVVGDPNSSIWLWDGGTALIELVRGEPSGRRLDVPQLRGMGDVRDAEAGFEYLWVAISNNAVLRIDLAGILPAEVVELPKEPAGIAITQRRVIVTAGAGVQAFVITPDSLELSVIDLADGVVRGDGEAGLHIEA
jgi:hypothetical protein